MKCLDDLSEFVKKALKCKNNYDKIVLLEDYPQCLTLLQKVYDPFYQIDSRRYKIFDAGAKYTIDIKNVEKRWITDEQFYDFLDTLESRIWSVTKTSKLIYRWIKIFPEHCELILRIIEKDLQIPLTGNDINMVYNRIIPKFGLPTTRNYVKMLDYYTTGVKHSRLDVSDHYIQPNIDGLRAAIICRHGKVLTLDSFGDRLGRLDIIEEEIRMFVDMTKPDDFILDGFIVIPEHTKKEVQRLLKEKRVKEIRKRPYLYDVKFIAIDYLTLREFEERVDDPESYYGHRFERLKKSCIDNLFMVDCIECEKYSKEALERWIVKCKKNNIKSFIVRRHFRFDPRTTHNILKYSVK